MMEHPGYLRILVLASVMMMVSGDIEDDFNKLYEIYSSNELFINPSDEHIQQGEELVEFDFNCPILVSPEIPTSVHKLRPGDIKVVAAVGDSLSTAYAAGAPMFLPVMLNYWGLSASIGGNANIKSVLTLPNILRHHNEHLYGYSSGAGVVFTQPKKKNLNFAVVGATADDIPKQVRKMIESIRDDPNVDVENDWKLVTLFIGGNDLCSGCERETSRPEAYLGFIEEALQILHDEVPRTLVNLVGVLNAYMLPDIGSTPKCYLVHAVVCKCLLKHDGKAEIYRRTKEYQRMVRAAIESGKYDDKEDFTVVYQPFFHDTYIPLKENGQPDASYFAADCFHLSGKGQAAQALANWNGLFEPVGSKRLEWVPGEQLQCPSEESPFIFTNLNSRPDVGMTMNAMVADHADHSDSGQSDEAGSTDSLVVVGIVGGVVAVIGAVIVVVAVIVKKRPTARFSYQKL